MSKNEFLREKPRGAKDEQLFNLLMKAVTLAAIFIGIWAGTQRFCRLVAYDPGWVGLPFQILKIGEKFVCPLYNPFLIFYWTLTYFKRTDIHPLLYSAYKIIGYTSISAIVFYFLKDMAKKFASPETYKTLEKGIFAQKQEHKLEQTQGVKI